LECDYQKLCRFIPSLEKTEMIKLINKIVSWVKSNKKEAIILGLILLVASFCRLYRIDQYMVFLGDEGRDAIIVRRIFTELHPPLIGPGTSVGNLYLGPLYYYMMAPALLIANFSPVGPAVQIALLGVITVAFVWWVGKKWFNTTAGLIAAGLFAISPTVIIYSRSSWNPNIMPFFALLTIYSIWKVWREEKFNWLIVLGLSFACVLQSHYLGLLLAPTIFIFWLLAYFKVKKTAAVKIFIKKSIIGFAGFIILMSPLFFFDLRHNWLNARSMYTFLIASPSTVSLEPWSAIPRLPVVLNLFSSSVVAARDMTGALIASLAIMAAVIWIFGVNYVKKKTLKIPGEYWLIFSWLGFGLIGFALYKQSIYDHYFGFLFPAPFLLIGILISALISKGRVLKWLGYILLVYLAVINLIANPLLSSPHRLLQGAIDAAKTIEQQSGGKPFNLAVIADDNYEAGYEYFLLKDNYPVVEIDAQKPDTITDQLFVVCELLPSNKCDPTHNPKAQVASFGWSKIDGKWTVDATVVYKLVHSK
jgi:4-amino-4-deoxy-L-arabinose transferase-like glycosyltransferase